MLIEKWCTRMLTNIRFLAMHMQMTVLEHALALTDSCSRFGLADCSCSHNVAKHGFLRSPAQVRVKQHSVATRELLMDGSCRCDMHSG